MRAYDLALFVHLVGVITLFSAVALTLTASARLRRAQTVQEVRLWLGFIRPTLPAFQVALLLLLISGLFMTDQAWSFTTPWVATGLLGLVVLGALGGSVQARRFATIGAGAAGGGDGPVPDDLARLVAAPALRRSMAISSGVAVGAVWLMATKPGWAGSVAAMLIFVALSLASVTLRAAGE